ncbi:Lipopolysaccharide-modifying protein [Cynara cardunculus var. scolymus]|uniref:Lipopolysaccharide-modifying protein n=1 Tax=Cynara cardunculus var. scolymus TaxID=59895 RepID=A0A103XNN2_CYNCS|nr:Lipopolysaccharide-modifying protein [Cynara cardunculus var. scolymus]
MLVVFPTNSVQSLIFDFYIDSTQGNGDQPQIMGLFARKTNRNPTSSPLSPFLVFFSSSFSLPSSSLSSLWHFVEQVDNLATQTKTIVGYNLKPTPWHEFPTKKFNNETKIARASKIIQCSYLSCRSHGLHSTTRILYADLMEVKKFASFRVVIIGGKLYLEYYYDCVQGRAMFMIWGLLQLLKRHPGRIPDVDFMFDCMDKPLIQKDASTKPMPIFRYCPTPDHYDIPFPDWSFWEINIAPWQEEFQSIKQGSQQQRWKKKHPYAYWKGNPDVISPTREALLMCNDTKHWGALIMRQNWTQEQLDGFKQSKLSNQCNHRYKIYAEGYAWSVSLKYILSCGCVPLIINPKYDDFFSRALFPKKDYLPISPDNICPSIKTAVVWGNAHPAKAEAIGKSVQDFTERLNIDRIYDYMYHLIVEYAKLLDFKPTRPLSALEECAESLYCFADGHQTRFLARSATLPSQSSPCNLPQQANRQVDKFIEEKSKFINSTQLLMQLISLQTNL